MNLTLSGWEGKTDGEGGRFPHSQRRSAPGAPARSGREGGASQGPVPSPRHTSPGARGLLAGWLQRHEGQGGGGQPRCVQQSEAVKGPR